MPGLSQHTDSLSTLCAMQDLSFKQFEAMIKGIRSLQKYQLTLHLVTRDGKTKQPVGQVRSVRDDERIKSLWNLRAQDTADRRRRYERVKLCKA